MLKSDDGDIRNYNIGNAIDKEPWVSYTLKDDRFVKIIHAEGTGLMVSKFIIFY